MESQNTLSAPPAAMPDEANRLAAARTVLAMQGIAATDAELRAVVRAWQRLAPPAGD